jgi:hypothetical protein
VSDVVGYSRLAGADEDRILAQLRALRSDLIDPTIAVHHGRVVKRTGDGSIVEFRSVVDAVNCATEVQGGMAIRNACMPAEDRVPRRVAFARGSGWLAYAKKVDPLSKSESFFVEGERRGRLFPLSQPLCRLTVLLQ